jgi:multimeric flavodoxin WrbA
MRIIGVSGSPRRGGNSDLILGKILEGARENGATTEAIHLSDLSFSSCVGCERCRREGICRRFDDDLTPIYSGILEAAGLVLVCPVYNYNLTSWMKAFIDRLYCFYEFDDGRPRGWSSRLAGQGRRALLAVVAEQVNDQDLGIAMEALRLPIRALGYGIEGEISVKGVFEAGVVANRPELLVRAREMGEELIKGLKSGA